MYLLCCPYLLTSSDSQRHILDNNHRHKSDDQCMQENGKIFYVFFYFLKLITWNFMSLEPLIFSLYHFLQHVRPYLKYSETV